MQATLFAHEHLEIIVSLVNCLSCVSAGVRFAEESCIQDNSDCHVDSFVVTNWRSCQGCKFQPRIDLFDQCFDALSKLQLASISEVVFCLSVSLYFTNGSTNHSKNFQNVMFGAWWRVDWKACRVKLSNHVKNRFVRDWFILHASAGFS